MVEPAHPGAGGLVVGANLDRHRPLGDRRQEAVERQILGDVALETEPLHPGRGEDDRVVLALLDPAHPRRHVAAQVDELEVGAIAREERPAPQTAGADAPARRQRRETGAGAATLRQPDVARILALEHGSEPEPSGSSVGRSFRLWTARSM